MTNAKTNITTRKHTVRRRWALGCLGAVGCLVLGAVVLGWVGRNLWQSEPGYWTANRAFVEQRSEAELNDLADGAFNRVMSELSYSRGYQAGGTEQWPTVGGDALGVRTIRLGFHEANAWLAARLDDWLVNQKRNLPAGLSGPMLASDSGRLVVAFRYRNEEVDQVFSVLMSLKFLDDGRATLSIDGVWGGRLPLPAEGVLKHLRGEEASQVVAVLLGQQAFDPVLPIDGSRRARIIGLEVDEDGVGLVVQAEKVESRR
jgi:hypothetical protein